MSPDSRDQESFISEKMVTLIFDQVKGSSEETSKTVRELTDCILELISKIQNSPMECLEILKMDDQILKDLVRDIESLEDKVKKVETIYETTTQACSKIESLKNNLDSINRSIQNIETIKNYLQGIRNNIWKFYTVIAVSFTLGLLILGDLIYLHHVLSQVSQILLK